MRASFLTLLGATGALAYPPSSPSLKSYGTSPASTYSVHASLATGTSEKVPCNGTEVYHSPKLSNRISSTATATATTSQQSDYSTTAFPTDIFTHGSIPTLRPVVPADHDADSLDCLKPQKPGPGQALHYAQENKPGHFKEGVFAIVTPNFKYPSVVLDYANSANTVKMTRGGDMIIGFTDLDAFSRSLSSWQSLGDIVFVTFTPGCGDFEDGERCYYLATELDFDQDSLTVRAVGKARDVRDLSEDIHVGWGSYNDEYLNAYPAASMVPTGTSTGSVVTPTGAPSTNGTNSTNVDFGNTDSACKAPADTKYGLPTTCVGPHFDDNLDSGLGYNPSTDFSWSDWVDATSIEDLYAEPYQYDATSLNKRDIAGKVGGFLKSIPAKAKKGLNDAGKTVVDKAKNAGNNIGAVVKGTVKVAQTVGTITANIITGKPNVYENEFKKLMIPPKKDDPECKKDQKKCELNAKDAKAVKTPWDDEGILIKSWGKAPSESELIQGKKTRTSVKGQFLNIYCVKCGLHGSAKIRGSLTIKNFEVHEGSIDIDLNMEVGMGIGIYAQWIRKETFDTNLFNVPISPFTIGVLTIGPYISIGTRAEFQVNATGSALARADLKFANAKFSYDFKNKKSSNIGFSPQIVPKFELEGEVSLEANFGVPVALKVGLSTFKGCKRCEAAIGIEDYPHLKATAQIAIEASAGGENKTNFTAGIKAINNCTGVYAALSFGNTVSAVFNGFGFVEQKFDIWKMPEVAIKSWCLGKKTNSEKPKRSIDSPHEVDLRNYPRADNDTALDLVDLTEYVVSDIDEPVWDGPDLPNWTYELEEEGLEGYWYTTVVYSGADSGTEGDYVLVTCQDGNIYIQQNKTANSLEWYDTCTSLWGGYDDTILSDPNGGILHYYSNSMSKTGVSRVRSANAQEVPESSIPVVLAPFYYDDADPDASVLAAFDPEDKILFPVICTYKDGSSAKIYLVENIDTGIETLKSADVKYSITNGDVDTCSFLPLAWGADETATEPEWAIFEDEELDNFEVDIEFDLDDFSNGEWNEEDEVDDTTDVWFEEFDDLMFDESDYTDEPELE